MEQITISVPFAEELIKAECKNLVQDHIDRLWAMLPEDLKGDVMEVLR